MHGRWDPKTFDQIYGDRRRTRRVYGCGQGLSLDRAFPWSRALDSYLVPDAGPLSHTDLKGDDQERPLDSPLKRTPVWAHRVSTFFSRGNVDGGEGVGFSHRRPPAPRPHS